MNRGFLGEGRAIPIESGPPNIVKMIVNDVAEYLSGEGLGIYDPNGTSGNIFCHRLPDSPDVAMALYATSGSPPDLKGVDRPGLQIIVRGDRNAETAYALAESVRLALHNPSIRTFVAGGRPIILCGARQSEPIAMGPDENGRYEFSLNIGMIIGG